MFKKITFMLLIVVGLATGVSAEQLSLNNIMEGVCRINGGGSGTCISEDANSYYVLTNAHVVGSSRSASLEFFHSGYKTKKIQASVIWQKRVMQTDIDFAILSVSKVNFASVPDKYKPRIIPLGPKGHTISEGEYISAAGCPAGRWVQGWEGRILTIVKGVDGKPYTRVGAVLTWRIGDRSAPERSALGAAIPVTRLYQAMAGEVINPERVPASWTPVKYVSQCSDGVTRNVLFNPELHERPVVAVPNKSIYSVRTFWIDDKTGERTQVQYDPAIRWFVPRRNPQPRPNPVPPPGGGRVPSPGNPYGGNLPDIEAPQPGQAPPTIPVPEVPKKDPPAITKPVPPKTIPDINIRIGRLEEEKKGLETEKGKLEGKLSALEVEKTKLETAKTELKTKQLALEEEKKNLEEQVEKEKGGFLAKISKWIEANPTKSGIGLAVLFAVAWFAWNRIIRKRLVPVIDNVQDFLEAWVGKVFGAEAAKDVREWLEGSEEVLIAFVDQFLREKREATRLIKRPGNRLRDKILKGNEVTPPPVDTTPEKIVAAAAVATAEQTAGGNPVDAEKVAEKIKEIVKK
jgi:hypothetical protein